MFISDSCSFARTLGQLNVHFRLIHVTCVTDTLQVYLVQDQISWSDDLALDGEQNAPFLFVKTTASGIWSNRSFAVEPRPPLQVAKAFVRTVNGCPMVM